MLFAEAKGFDVKIIRLIIRIRRQDSNERAEEETILDLYLRAFGMAPSEGEYGFLFRF
ncbi:MAG: DUF2312 domain-containing protein [Hyphomicrobiales bacterium]|nr:DUF2312 domain-containing protein [Hyphomicrobiales bacterium]